jgi:hypothetical protein
MSGFCGFVPRAAASTRSARAKESFSRFFLRSDNFWLQNCAIRRNATKISSANVTSEKQAAQYREKLRKRFLN